MVEESKVRMSLPPLPLIDGCLFVDNSLLADYLNTCPRALEYHWLRDRCLEEKRPSLNYGSSIHLALHHRYLHYEDPSLSGELPKMEKEQFHLLQEFFVNHPSPEGEYRDLDLAWKTTQAYNRKYGVEDFTVLSDEEGRFVESAFAAEFGTIGGIRVFMCGRIDLVVERDKQVFLVDHKTSSMMGSGFFKENSVSPQYETYCWGWCQTKGTLPAGFIVNGIRVPRPTRKELVITGDDFERSVTYLREGQIEEWHSNTTALLEEFLWNYNRGYLPQKKKWCVGKYGACEFFEVCNLPPEHRGLMLESGLYVKNEWSPLDEIVKNRVP